MTLPNLNLATASDLQSGNFVMKGLNMTKETNNKDTNWTLISTTANAIWENLPAPHVFGITAAAFGCVYFITGTSCEATQLMAESFDLNGICPGLI